MFVPPRSLPQHVVALTTSVNVPLQTIYLQLRLKIETTSGPFAECLSQPLGLSRGMAEDLVDQISGQLATLRSSGATTVPSSGDH